MTDREQAIHDAAIDLNNAGVAGYDTARRAIETTLGAYADTPRCRVCRRPMSIVRVSDVCGPCQGGVLPPPVPVDLRLRRKPAEEGEG